MLRKVTLVAILLVIAVVAYFGIKTLIATSRIISRDKNSGAPAFAGAVDPTKLRGEGDGRVNILLLGIGGQGHEAPNLSDTIIVASIDPRTKDVAMLSVPRDLWVSIPQRGYAKVNAAYAYGEMSRAGNGPALAKATISKILDLPIHYYIRVDFAGFRQAIDTVGGVDVHVDKPLYDPYFPSDSENGWYQPFYITAGDHHMGGVIALRYARSRETTSDFDRAARQQKVLVALRQKVLSSSTLLNPAKITSLINIFGNHIETDLKVNEMLKLTDLIKGVDTTKITNKVLDNTPQGLLKDGNVGGAYVLLPRAGNFSEVQAFAHSIFVDSYLKDEHAAVEVSNGAARAGVATAVAQALSSYNYNVTKVTTAPAPVGKTVIYDYTGGTKPYTINYLEARFKLKVQKMPKATAGAPEIKIVIGQDYKNNAFAL